MGACEDFLQIADANLEVLRRGLDVVVAEELLDIADIDSPFEEVGRAGVPQVHEDRGPGFLRQGR